MSRPAGTREVADFLASASIEPSALVVEGEAGIGKTTLCLTAVDLAGERGFRVLLARPGAAESVMAYAALADMLGVIESDTWPDLPSAQQLALDRVLLQVSADGPTTDQRAVAAAFLSVVEHLAAKRRCCWRLMTCSGWILRAHRFLRMRRVGFRGVSACSAHSAPSPIGAARQHGCPCRDRIPSSESSWGPGVLARCTLSCPSGWVEHSHGP